MIGNLTDEDVVLRVPIEFPLDGSLSYNARILGLIIQIGVYLKYDTKELISPKYLARQIPRKGTTIAKAIAELEASRWDYDKPFKIEKNGKYINVSSLLILDKRLTNCTKLLFCFLLILQVLNEGLLETRFSELHKKFGLGFNTVKRGFAALRASKWLITRQNNKHAPLRIWLDFPLKRPLDVFRAMVKDEDMTELIPCAGDSIQDTQVQSVYSRLDNMFNLQKGTSRVERLVLGALTLIVDSDYYDDHYTPKFFPSWGTDHPMHFDRLYHRQVVAIEFNGPQHYYETEWFDAETVAQQKWNDYNKRENCKINDVTLIELTIEDLSVERIQEKLKGHLPLRELPKFIIRYINSKFNAYLESCRFNNLKPAMSGATS